MTIKIVTAKNVNIYEFPNSFDAHLPNKNSQITIGDLHGNAIKLLHFLVYQRVLTIDRKDYATLVSIYQKDVNDLTAADLKNFVKILQRSQIHEIGLIRLLGDEVADRGNNDFFTLHVFEFLQQRGLPFEILFSNHGLTFIDAFEHPERSSLNQSLLSLGAYQSKSLFNLMQLIDKFPVLKNTVHQCIFNSYLPHVKLISYSVNKHTQPPSLTFYSHAPIGMETIRALAENFSIEFKTATLKEFCTTIDAINAVITSKLMNGKLTQHKDFSTEILRQLGGLGGRPISSDYPLLRIAWNRGAEDNLLKQQENFLSQHHTYTINAFVHGHDGPLNQDGETLSYNEKMLNLDSYSGRSDVGGDHKPYLALYGEGESLS